MTSSFTRFNYLVFALLLIFTLSLTGQAQNVFVTFRLNTCTNLDTMTAANGFVEIRGALNTVAPANLPGGQVIAWDKTSTLEMVNVGGDYWELTVEMVPDDTLYYKFWTGYSPDVGTFPNGGWEGPFSPSNGLTWDTRTFISGTTDTVLDVQYYHPQIGGGTAVDQYLKPFETKADSVAIYFRVNIGGEMEAERFNPVSNGPIGIRGDNVASGQRINWSANNVELTREVNSIYNGSFWSGVAYFAKDSVEAGVEQQFKYFAENTPEFSWEDGGNHIFKYPEGLKDTTIAWTWFSNKHVTGVAPITSIITWRVSTEALEAIGMFDRGVGDRITVLGPRGWSDTLELAYQPLLREWDSGNESFKLPPGTEIFYKYYVAWDSSRVDSLSANYIKGITLANGWEEPGSTGGGNRIHVFQDASQQDVVGDFGFDRQFFNSVPANGVFDQDIAITWNVDMTNATNPDSNTLGDLFRPGIDTVWVQFDGELMGITHGFGMWDAAARFLILTDDNADMIYSGTYTMHQTPKYPNGWYQLGYKIAYSTADGGRVVHGSGVDRGRRYLQYIHPDEILPGSPWPVPQWPAEFNLPVVSWRKEMLFTEYPPPDLTQATGIANQDKVVNSYKLEQNYPNPFNPSTSIKYRLAKPGNITIRVYNVAGQLVTTLINTWQNRGAHSIEWNGKNSRGENVGSGIYFVKMVAGDYSNVKKMTLLR
jgi:hypothetical protein